MDSILTSVKKMIGIDASYTHFDTDIIMHINSVFMILNQLGVGPPAMFTIQDEYAVWTDFISEDGPQMELVKSYMYLRVKLLFSPPDGTALLNSSNEMIKEFEWRLNVAAESNT